MARLCRLGFQLVSKTVFPSVPIRNIATSSVNRLKEIRDTKIGDELIIEGVYIKSPREDLLVKPPVGVNEEGKPLCYLCALDLDIKHTDVLILSQFLRSDGCVLPRRTTGLCRTQQKRISKLVAMAQKAGLMINITPDNCNKDPTKRFAWKKFNTYYDETTIFKKKPPKISDRFKR